MLCVRRCKCPPSSLMLLRWMLKLSRNITAALLLVGENILASHGGEEGKSTLR